MLNYAFKIYKINIYESTEEFFVFYEHIFV